ncbi:MAG TPA: energy transducer TonB [candidate division Zixibacteria bacterium]|nr:energy transducer TonB [candidate division Zixibacteria bacterium]
MSVNSLYSQYGAYAMKARYQRNFLYGIGITAGTVAAILLTFWIISLIPEEEVILAAPIKTITTVADLGPPPSIARKPPQVAVQAPQTAAPKVGIPKPVADDEVIDDDVVLATKDELAEIVAPDVVTAAAGEDIVVDIAEDDYLPAPDEFVAVEIYPEMIFNNPPEYPRFAKTAGIEGTVAVQALVGKNGNVLDARVGKSSGTAALDDAAVQAAYGCKFKPGIQNGRPVACWVTYAVEFEIGK